LFGVGIVTLYDSSTTKKTNIMHMKKKALALVSAVSLSVSLLMGHSYAATGSIYISPANASVQSGSDISVQLRIDPGTAVNAVQATVGYNASDLQYVSSSLGVFSTCTQDSGGGGSVTFGCAELGSSTSSDSLIATITFQALAGSGSTSLDVSNAEAANNGTYTDPTSSGGTISFTAPVVATAPTQSSSTSSSASTTTARAPTKTSTTAKAATPTAAATATPPAAVATTTIPTPKVTIKSVAVAPSYTTAKVRVTTSVAAQSTIIYGTSKDDLNGATQLTSSGSEANATLSSQLIPGTLYYYKLVSTLNGTMTTSSLKSFTTEGYSVNVTVLDSTYHPLTNAVVTLHSTPTEATTNRRGVATFNGIAPGMHHIIYSVHGHSYSQPLYVTNAMSEGSLKVPALQTAAVILAGYRAPSNSLTALAAGLVVVVGIGVGSLFLYEQLRMRNKTTHKPTTLQSSPPMHTA
jgi:hypothetical protein